MMRLLKYLNDSNPLGAWEIQRFFISPCPATWEAAAVVVVRADVYLLLGEAVMSVDPLLSRHYSRGAYYWSKTPDTFTVARALREVERHRW